MRRTQCGFTLVELLIFVCLLCVLAACLAPNALKPDLVSTKDATNALGDAANLRTHYAWMLTHKRKHTGALPQEGGYRFVLATWTAKVFDHTRENFDRFWTPGPATINDPVYAELSKMVERGENPWPDLAATTSESTHYVGRSKMHRRTAESSAEEAWMANDNEGGWSLRDGTIHVLLYGGAVRTYEYGMLREQFGFGPFDRNTPIRTWGPDSPIPACQKLDN